METSEHLDIDSNKDSRTGNLSLNGNANISGRTTSHLRNETIVDGGSNLQCNTECSSRNKRNKRKNQMRRQNPLEKNAFNHDLLEDISIETATLERNSNVGPTVDVNLGNSLQMAQCDSGSSLPGKKKGKRCKKNANTPKSNDMHHNHQEGTPSMKNTPMERDSLSQPSVNTTLPVDSEMKNYDAEGSSNQEMNEGKEQKETHNVDRIDIKCLKKVDANSVLEFAEQLNSLPACADTSSTEKKKGKRHNKKPNALNSTDMHHNHQEGTPSMKNTPMETDLFLRPSVNTPLKVDPEMKNCNAEATSNQEMNKGKVQNDTHNLVEINNSHHIPEGDEGPNSVSEVAKQQLNSLPDCADTSSKGKKKGKKKGKRRKKNTNAPDSTDMSHNHQEGTPSLKNTPMETDLLPQPSVCTPLKVDSKMKNYDAEASSNQELNKGEGQNETHNLVDINNSHDIQEGDGRPNSVSEVAEQLNSLPACADTSSRVKKKGKRRNKKPNTQGSTDIHHNHQEGTPLNTPMETDLLPQRSVNTPLKVDSDLINNAEASSNQEMNKGKVQNDTHNLVEINNSHHIPEGDVGPNSVSEVAKQQLNSLPDCADTSSKGKKKGKRRKKNTNAPDSTDMSHNHQEDTPSMKNTPMEKDLLPQPSVNTPFKVDSEMINYDAEASSNQEMNKGEEQNETHNLMEINNSHDIQEGDGRPNSVSEVAELNSLLACVDITSSTVKKKGKRHNKKPNAPDSTDMHHNHQKGTPSMKNAPMETNLLPQPSVNTPLQVDSEMIDYDAEASSNQEMNKGKEQNETHNLMEINNSHDIQEGDGRPNVDIIDIKCLKNLDANSVLEVAEQLNSLPDCVDTNSRGKHDTHVEEDVIPIEAMNMKTYKRKKRVKQYSSKRSKLSNAEENNLESVEECSVYSVLVVKNRVGDNSFGCSDEALPSCCPENMLEREVLAGHGTSLQVVECISVEKASSLFSESESTPEGINQRIEMRPSRLTISEGNFLTDVSIVDNPRENLEPDQRRKLKVAQNVEGNVCSVEENNCEHTEVCEQKTMEIQSKMEDSNSSIQLDAIKDVSPVLVKEDHPPQPLQQSPERALTSRLRRKLLILDLNGLLVDIVESVPDGYKADTRVGRKELFKRPFCDDFLQFCFERFNVGVWSSRTKRNVDSVLDFLMVNSKRKLLFCWDQFHCTQTGYNTIENREKPLLLKELKKLWEKHERNLPWGRGEYNESNTVLLDDSPYKALLNPPHTAIFPRSYGYKDVKDNSLGPQGDLRVYLEGLALAENVQQYIEQNPFGQRPITEKNSSWAFYRKIITAFSSQPAVATKYSSAYNSSGRFRMAR